MPLPLDDLEQRVGVPIRRSVSRVNPHQVGNSRVGRETDVALVVKPVPEFAPGVAETDAALELAKCRARIEGHPIPTLELRPSTIIKLQHRHKKVAMRSVLDDHLAHRLPAFQACMRSPDLGQ